MKVELWDAVLYDDFAEIANIYVYWIHIKKVLNVEFICTNVVEYGREVHKEHREDAVKILHVTEEHVEGGENHTHANIEECETNDRKEEHKKIRMEGNPIKGNKDKVNNEGKQKVDGGLNITRKEKHIFRNVNLCENAGV